jgi:N utilization substance protein B
MTRRETREQIFKLLFRAEFNKLEEMDEQTAFFFADDENARALEAEEDIKTKLNKVLERLPELDKMLGEKADHWEVERMGKVDLTILRLALYEIVFDEDIPEGVAINEAVELAKKYGQDNSRAFVNGVLSRFAGESEGDTQPHA